MILCTNLNWNAVSAIGTLLSGIMAAIALIYAYKTVQLALKSTDLTRSGIEQANKLAAFNIYMKFADALSEPDAILILSACDNKSLTISYRIQNIEINEEDSRIITVNGNYLNKMVLNPLADLMKFHEDGLISSEKINAGFGYTILLVGNNDKIRGFLADMRKQAPNSYKSLERLYALVYEMNKKIKDTYEPKLFPVPADSLAEDSATSPHNS